LSKISSDELPFLFTSTIQMFPPEEPSFWIAKATDLIAKSLASKKLNPSLA
jgi:hypothetical protein